MNTHTPTGHWQYGLMLSILTALLFGILPIVLKGLLSSLDVITITWFRFGVAALLLAIVVARKNGLSQAFRLRGFKLLLLFLAVAGLCGNFALYLWGLEFVSPSTVQVVIQAAPMFLLIGSLAVFRESFSTLQGLGLITLVIGLILFFNQRYSEILSGAGSLLPGILITIAAAAFWAVYALSQKQLLKSLPSESIMFLIYLAGSLIFLPFSHPTELFQLSRLQSALLTLCALITLISYLSFAEALDHIEASRVGVVLVTTPLITVAGMTLFAPMLPDLLKPEELNSLSLAGALLVMIGSMLGSIGAIGRNEDSAETSRATSI